jgi:cathepsin F
MNLGILDWFESVTTSIDDLPKNFDWRIKNVVSQPKAQYSCGSCWAFATTGVLESQYFLKHGKHINLSE